MQFEAITQVIDPIKFKLKWADNWNKKQKSL